MTGRPNSLQELGCFADISRASLVSSTTPLEPMPRLSAHGGGAQLWVKRDDCTGLAFGGNKVRQLEFYLGDALAKNADTILITSAVQSNFVRTAAAAACKLGLQCHVQLEERVANTDPHYRESGNVLIDRLMGATIHSYADGEDETGADQQVASIAQELQSRGANPYVIPLAPGHPPLGALGYVVAAHELLSQIDSAGLSVDQVFVGSGSGATHAGLLFGLRVLGSDIGVTGVCVRRDQESQRNRVRDTCQAIATLVDVQNPVTEPDIRTTDAFLAPGYGVPGDAVLDAIVLGARLEGLIVDPVYTGKVLAAVLHEAARNDSDSTSIFLHTGGTPAIFAYQNLIKNAAERQPGSQG